MTLKLAILLAVVVLFDAISVARIHGQGFQAVEAGSVEAHVQRVRAQNQAMEIEIAARERLEKWHTTKKLKLTQFDEDPIEPHRLQECLDPEKFIDGDVGSLDYFMFEVFDIVGPQEVFLILPESESPPICLKDCPTKGLVNEQLVVLIGLVEVKGTKSYIDTEGGSNTIRVVRFITAERKAAIDKQLADQIAAERDVAEELLYRIWTSSKGNHTIEAKFVKFEKGKVHLQKRDGSVIGLAPKKLSKEDRDFYRELIKMQNDPAYQLLQELPPN
ncbi:MAG: SHD1 domain-containing protein [Bythopirellula sp.]|nr:SHD1 domain-containing protein [Bythopirellula sp.]